MKNSLEANDLIIKTQVHVSWELTGVLSVQYKHRFEICSYVIGRRKGGEVGGGGGAAKLN